MLNGQKKERVRNYVHIAMVRLNKKSVAHGKTKKADRRQAHVQLHRDMEAV